MKTNKGISLITLVITIVVMIILAGVIILTLSSNGIIGKANEAVEKTNIQQIESLATMLWAEAYEKSNGSQGALYDAVMEGLRNNEITPDKYEGYRIDVTESGVKVVKIGTSSDDQPSGNLPTSSDDQPSANPLVHAGTIPTGGRYGYAVGTDSLGYLNEGEAFPTSVKSRDEYYYGDYTYRYDSYYDGWNVRVSDTSKTEYGAILESINGKDVVTMDYTFSGCSQLTTVTAIPSTITRMNCTFQNCTSLVTVAAIPNTVTSMNNVFSGCSALTTAPMISTSITSWEGLFQNCAALTTIPEIPSGVTNLDYAFSGCTSLTTVSTIPSTVTSMQHTFENCTSLVTAPTIQSGVTNMAYAFSGCTSLTTVSSIPTSVTSMAYAFQNCAALNSIQYSGTVEEWESNSIYKYGWHEGSSITGVKCSNKDELICAQHSGRPTSTEGSWITCDNCGTSYWGVAPY